LRHQTTDKVQKHNSFNTNTPSSESYRNYLNVIIQKRKARTCAERMYRNEAATSEGITHFEYRSGWCCSPASPHEIQNSAFKQVTTASFQILNHAPFTNIFPYHPYVNLRSNWHFSSPTNIDMNSSVITVSKPLCSEETKQTVQQWHIRRRKTRPHNKKKTYEGVTKRFRTGRLKRELQMVQLSATSWVVLLFSESV
jgi:hypothetical protein